MRRLVRESIRRRTPLPPSGPTKVHSNSWLTTPLDVSSTPQMALLLLNTPPRPATALRQLWTLSAFRVCADAAANRLRDSIQLAMGDESVVSGTPAQLRQRLLELRRVAKQHESMVPDAVIGDFDSIRPDVLDFYREHGTAITYDPSQSTTDFQKALKLIEDAQAASIRSPSSLQGAPPKRWTVVAFGAFGDRFDHELASINTLYRFCRPFDRLILMGERMTAELLLPGRHVIRPNSQLEGPTCGLLPIGGRCDAVWTSGLRWNLRGSPLQFGGVVSSSNDMVPHAVDGRLEVRVTTTHPLVWTTVLRPDGWPRSG